jgi:hypothetical protein
MTTYRYEYGQRWNSLLPRRDIAFLVHRMHCGTSDEEVIATILARATKSGIPESMLPACARYALYVHREQANLYRHVSLRLERRESISAIGATGHERFKLTEESK